MEKVFQAKENLLTKRLTLWKIILVWQSEKSSVFCSYPGPPLPFAYTLLNHKKHKNEVTMCFFKLLHIPPFLIKKPPKIGIQGNNLHIFLWHLQDQKIFSKKPPTIHFEMPKKMMPKSQAKIKPPFSQYPFFNYF